MSKTKPSPAVERVMRTLVRTRNLSDRGCAEDIIRALADVTEAEAERMCNAGSVDGLTAAAKAEILSLLEPLPEPKPVDPRISILMRKSGYTLPMAQELLDELDKAREVKP